MKGVPDVWEDRPYQIEQRPHRISEERMTLKGAIFLNYSYVKSYEENEVE